MTAPRARPRRHRQVDAGAFGPEIASFRLHLAAEGKALRTSRLYADAAAWFAAERLECQAGKGGWEEADRRDVEEWMAWLLGRYSDAYASNQYRALQQFFKWLSAEEGMPDPMAGLSPPKVTTGLVPVFTGAELARLERACAGRGFAERRDAAIIAVLRASGIRLSELADIRYDPQDPRRSDINVWQREITVLGKGGRPRIVKIDYDAARALDRYLRGRARHPQAWRTAQTIAQVKSAAAAARRRARPGGGAAVRLRRRLQRRRPRRRARRLPGPRPGPARGRQRLLCRVPRQVRHRARLQAPQGHPRPYLREGAVP
jgi:site-specific recombinase XerD